MLQGIVDEIVREHVQLAAFQWLQLKAQADAHPPDDAIIDNIDERLRANLDAIEIAGDPAWRFILDQFEDFPEAGEIFVAGYLAMAQNDLKRIDQCLWMAHGAPESRAGLVGAFARVPPDVSGPTIRSMLDAKSEVQRAVAIDVLTAHAADAGRRQTEFLADPSLVVRASACALAAAACREDCVETIARLAESEDAILRFAAAEALARLGRSSAATLPLKAEVEASGPRAESALRILSQVLDNKRFRAYLGVLYGKDITRPLSVRGVGMMGDQSDTKWLLEQMQTPQTAIAAGESFLELFPEASEAEGLFTDDQKKLGKAFATLTDQYPDASRIRSWLNQSRPPDSRITSVTSSRNS